MSRQKIKIILIDQDTGIHDFVKQSLALLNAEIHSFTSPRAGLKQALILLPNLVILDMLNSEMDGVETCSEFRTVLKIKDLRIAFFTSRNEDYSQIAGFHAGADDYILKPCRPQLFQSRIKALLKWFKARPDQNTGPEAIAVDRERYVLRKGKYEIILPRKELELMSLLLECPRKVFTRQEIYNEIWGGEMDNSNRTIDVHVRKLREKIGNNHIKTVKGIGYSFEP
jgi:two-component system alkaline phosphatase synthesis response regulator PhoP